MCCQGKCTINQFWFDFQVILRVLGDWGVEEMSLHTCIHTQTHTPKHTNGRMNYFLPVLWAHVIQLNTPVLMVVPFLLPVRSSVSSPCSSLFVRARLYLNQAVCCFSSLRLCVTLPFANQLRLVSKHVTHNMRRYGCDPGSPVLDHMIWRCIS